jgi:hypothetical protein
MNSVFLRWFALALMIGLLAVMSFGCVMPGGGYGYGGGGSGRGYYEPYGASYGGWSSGYRVAPYHDGDHRQDFGGGHPPSNAYRPAPASRAMPSIPSGSRSYGGQGGGYGDGHGGGNGGWHDR